MANGIMGTRKNGFVYLAKDNVGNIKVGATENVKRRMAQLTMKVTKVELIATIPAVKFEYLEKMLHYHLSENHAYGEWFNGEQDVLSKTVDFLRKYGAAFGASFIAFESPSKTRKNTIIIGE